MRLCNSAEKRLKQDFLYKGAYNSSMTMVSETIKTFFRQFKEQSYKKGEVMIRAQESPPGIFYIEEGLIKVYAISQKGNEHVVNVFKSGAFFPMSWALNDTPNKYFYEAVMPVVVRKIPKEKVLSFIKEDPEILLDLLQRVYRGTDGLLQRIDSLMNGNAYFQLITEIHIYAKRFGVRKGDAVEMKITEMELAQLAGLTRETVSREMKKLKDKNLVTFSKNMLEIPNSALLEEELLLY